MTAIEAAAKKPKAMIKMAAPREMDEETSLLESQYNNYRD